VGWESRENRIVAAAFRRYSSRAWFVTAALAAVAASSAIAQQGGGQKVAAAPDTAHALKLPENPQVFGTAMPSVIKATAIVNGDVITQTDVDQRLQLLAIANGSQIPPEQMAELRQQVLRNLIDETLEVQAAKAEKIDI
jgi:peptidyl-prolyl cis-trans isomerase SurA